MTTWEKQLVEFRREETFMKRFYQRLMKLKADRKEAKEHEKRLMEMLGSIHLQGSGF
jgi:hypothetical protein